jgi:hypothetical protein
MFIMFKSLFSGHSAPTDAERELAYLNASVSLADLERRQRDIDQGLLRRPTFAL